MKSENELNAKLSSLFKERWPEKREGSNKTPFFHQKVCDKISEGCSDFIVWHNQKTLALECKYLSEMKGEKSNAKVLSHEFSQAQITYLESQWIAHNLAFGLVYIEELGKAFLFDFEEIPRSGNWKNLEFRDTISKKQGYEINRDGVDRMIHGIFGRSF